MVIDNITTEKHLQVYVKETCRLIQVFGLKHREFYFNHADIECDDPGARVLACFEYGDDCASWVRFTLGKKWGTQKITTASLKATALHEVYHFLLSEYNALCRDRFVTESQIMQEEHRIISRLMNITFGKI